MIIIKLFKQAYIIIRKLEREKIRLYINLIVLKEIKTIYVHPIFLCNSIKNHIIALEIESLELWE